MIGSWRILNWIGYVKGNYRGMIIVLNLGTGAAVAPTSQVRVSAMLSVHVAGNWETLELRLTLNDMLFI